MLLMFGLFRYHRRWRVASSGSGARSLGCRDGERSAER